MIIALDMDDVICDLVPEWLNRYNNDYDDCLTKDDIKSWNMAEHVKCGKAIYDYLNDKSLYRYAPVIYNAIEVTKQWLEEGHTIIVVTRVHYPCAASEKMKWLQKYFPHLTNVVIVTSDIKHHIDADVLIDDGVHNLEKFKGFRVLMHRPWNSTISHEYISAKNWHDLKFIIHLLTVRATIPNFDNIRSFQEGVIVNVMERIKELHGQFTNTLSE